MDTTEKLMYDFENNEHPLGKGITEIEIPDLVNSLRKRLNISKNILDLKPKSLNILAKSLLEFYQLAIQNNHFFSDEEIAQIVREIAAYLGKVILDHSDGEWKTDLGHFSNIAIKITEQIFRKKGILPKVSSSWLIPLAFPACRTWTAVQMGIEPKLYFVYKSSISKVIKEKL